MSKDMLLVLAACIAMQIPQHAAASQPVEVSSASSACNVSVSEIFLKKGDRHFDDFIAQLNSYFAKPAAAGPIGKPGRLFPTSDAQTLHIEVEKASCIDPKRLDSDDPQNAAKAVGGCDHVGCAGDLGPEFSTLPPGSTITISVCNGTVQSTGSFLKNASWVWVMTAYSEAAVPGGCPTGPGPQ